MVRSNHTLGQLWDRMRLPGRWTGCLHLPTRANRVRLCTCIGAWHQNRGWSCSTVMRWWVALAWHSDVWGQCRCAGL